MSSHIAFILKMSTENETSRLTHKFAVRFAFRSIYLYIICLSDMNYFEGRQWFFDVQGVIDM